LRDNVEPLRIGALIVAVVVLAGPKEHDSASAVLQTFAGHHVTIAKAVHFRIAAAKVRHVKTRTAGVVKADPRRVYDGVRDAGAFVGQRELPVAAFLDGDLVAVQGDGGAVVRRCVTGRDGAVHLRHRRYCHHCHHRCQRGGQCSMGGVNVNRFMMFYSELNH